MSTVHSHRTPSEIATQILEEHDALREKFHHIHAVLTEPEPNRAEIDSLLREFLNALVVHFSMEEDEGFFSEVANHAPRLTSEADKLCVEHTQLLDDAKKLIRFASVGSPSMSWWRELSVRCHELSKRLMQHESRENKLLQEAHQSDIGITD